MDIQQVENSKGRPLALIMAVFMALGFVGCKDNHPAVDVDINYKVSGSLILERQLNTQIPDEDQSIEW